MFFGTILDEIKINTREAIEPNRPSDNIDALLPVTFSHKPPNYSGEIAQHGIDALIWTTIYISEALKKKDIFFKRFDQLSNSLRKAFYIQGPEAKNYWDYFIEDPAIIDSSHSGELDKAFDKLAKLVSMEARLTSYLALFLLRSGILKYETLTRELKQRGIDTAAWLLKEKGHQMLAVQYNSHISYLRQMGLTSLATRIPEDELTFQDTLQSQ